jgi:hypothetical protein
MIRMQPYVIAALARHYGLRRSALSSALFDEVEDAAYAAQVGAWYESLAANNRLGQQHLAALVAPDLLADVRILHGRERLTRFLLLAQLGTSGGACVLAGLQTDGELELRPVEGVEAVSDSILLMLGGDSEPAEPEMNVGLSHAELAALLAWTDLEARATFVSLIAHRDPKTSSKSAWWISGATGTCFVPACSEALQGYLTFVPVALSRRPQPPKSYWIHIPVATRSSNLTLGPSRSAPGLGLRGS